MAKIFFDFDGVLVQSRSPNKTFLWQKDIEQDLKIPAHVRSLLFQQPEWNEIISGRGDFRKRLEETFRVNGLSLTAEVFVDYWLSRDLNWRQDVLTVASNLKKAGHSLFIATNQDRVRANFIKNQQEITSIFEGVFTSSELGVCKPSPAFFETIQGQKFSGINDIFIMIDDDPRNVEAANSLGWRGLTFNPDLEKSHSIEFLKATLAKAL